jgi:glycosyltransferase involved in cell wall biosynthesis
LRILLLTHSFYPIIGGIEVIAEFLALALTRAGHEVHVVTNTASGTDRIFPYTVIRNPGRITLLQEHRRADMVFENNPCLRLSWPVLFFNKPLIISLHTWISDPHGRIRIQDRLKHRWLKRAGQVIACSNALQKKSWPAATVIHNPYNDIIFKETAIKKTRDFVFLGRLVSDKGADMAVEALHRLVQKEPGKKYTLTIIGDGPDKTRLENLVKTLKLNDQVLFDGMITGTPLAHRLNQHRFILVPSRWKEPFGLVALEGMACGCLPIVSDGGGLPEAIGNAGLVFIRGDASSLTECMWQIINNPVLEKELREKKDAHLRAHRSDAVAAKYMEIIEKTAAIAHSAADMQVSGKGK